VHTDWQLGQLQKKVLRQGNLGFQAHDATPD
jgi:hypothetical protein